MDFHHPHFNTDSYSHLSSFHQGTQQYHQLHPADRNVLRPREDQIHMHTGLTAPHDVRRTDYGALRRPDVLVPGAHHLSFGEQDAAMLNIHPGTGLPIIDEANHQVGMIIYYIIILLFLMFHFYSLYIILKLVKISLLFFWHIVFVSLFFLRKNVQLDKFSGHTESIYVFKIL